MFTYKSRSFFPFHRLLKGALAGFVGIAPMTAVMVTGWQLLPAVGILPPATRHPWRRNLLMIVEHLVRGATMGMVLKKLNSERHYIDI
jgi:uncharacterized membrane protein YagU involved in acid resistance